MQSWEGPLYAALCWAGVSQRGQQSVYSLQAMGSKPSLKVPVTTLWSPPLTHGQCSPLSDPKSAARLLLEEVDVHRNEVNLLFYTALMQLLMLYQLNTKTCILLVNVEIGLEFIDVLVYIQRCTNP